MENNVQTLKKPENNVQTLKKDGYITEVVTPEALNDNISIAKYVTQVSVASQIKFEDTKEEGDNVSGGTNDGGSNDTPNADTTPKVDAPKEPVVEDTPATPEVTTKTPEVTTKTPEDEIVVDAVSYTHLTLPTIA